MGVYRSQVVISHPSLGGSGTNTWHVRTLSDGPEADSLLDELNSYIQGFYTGATAVLAGGTSVEHDGFWTRVDGGEATLVEAEGWTVGSGTTQAPLPPANCMVTGWRTNLASRSGRGRTFVGPLGVNTLQDNGTPTEASRASLLAAAETMIEQSDSVSNGAVVVWSPTDGVARDITGVRIANEFAVLRSRRD